MKKSNQEKRKAGIDNATEIVICDTPDERTLRSRQVERSGSGKAWTSADKAKAFGIHLSKFVRFAHVTVHRED